MIIRKITAIAALVALLSVSVMGCALFNQKESTVEESVQPREVMTEETFSKLSQKIATEPMDGVSEEKIYQTESNVYVDAHYPALTGNEPVSTSISNFVNGQIKSYTQEAQSTHTRKPEFICTYCMTYKPYRSQNGKLFSVKFSENISTDKLERTDYISTLVLDTETGKRMALDDLFDSSQNYLDQLSNLVQESLLRNEIVQKCLDEALLTQGTKPSGENFSNFVVTPENIIFFFNKNIVAPAGAGTLTVSIPISDLAAYLKLDVRDQIDGYATAAYEAALQNDPIAEPTQDPGASTAPQDPSASTAPQGTGLPEQLTKWDSSYMQPKSIDGIDVQNDKVIALTFDDGPSNYTPKILDALKSVGGKATFFLPGERVEQYSDVLKRTYEEGHDIGTHGYKHLDYTKQTLDEVMTNEIGKTNEVIASIVGVRPIIDRPPYGACGDELAQQIGREQIMWNVDPNDWKPENRNADIVYNNVMGAVKNGAVVLSHDIYESTADAYVRIIKELSDQGYKLVTITQMMQIAAARGQALGYRFSQLKTD